MNLIKRRIARLRGDQSGVAAVEFALLAPILIMLYFGMAEGTQALLAERKAVRTASAIGDLVAQYSTLTPAQIDDIIKIGDTLMSPYPTTTQLKVCVMSIEADKDNVKKVGWNRVKNGATCAAKGSSVTNDAVPADLIAANQSLIMAQVEYTYVGATSQIFSSPTFSKTFYLRPRKSQTVLCPTC